MIKLATATIVLLASTSAFAQPFPPSTPVESVSRPQPALRLTGAYLAPTAGFSSFNGGYAYLPGLRGAIMLNDKFGVGLAGNFIGTKNTSFDNDEVRDIGVYGGFYLQYVFRSSELLHAYADTTIGGGSFCARSVDDECAGREFGLVEPMVNLELNVAKGVRLAAGVGYRFAFAESGPGISSRDLSGTVARTSLSIGVF